MWATSTATKNITVETRKRCSFGLSTRVTAIHAANATAAWPEGRPPRSGVPRPVSAFVAITRMTTRISAISVTFAGASRSRSKEFVVFVADVPGEDEVADGDRVDRRDQDGAGGDVLRELRERVERARRQVDRRLDRRVDHLGDQDERNREQERDELEPVDADPERHDHHGGRGCEVDPHVPMRPEDVDDPLDREVEALDDRDPAAPLAGAGEERAGAVGRPDAEAVPK